MNSLNSPTMLRVQTRLSPAKIREELADKQFVSNEVLLVLDEQSSPLNDLDVVSAQDGYVRARLAPGEDLAEKLAQLRSRPDVLAADVNSIVELNDTGETPDDLSPRLWGLQNVGQDDGVAGADINALEAWREVRGSRQGPVIAVIDTGIDLSHPDLAANLWTNVDEIPNNGVDDDNNGVVDDVHGYNAADDNAQVQDARGHGTHVAGTIAAAGNNGQGVVGVNWEAQLMPVKIFDDNGRATVEGIVRGLLYAHDNGASITNNSWGSRGYNEVLNHVFQDTNDMLHVAAAGNNGRSIDFGGSYPAAFSGDHIISVAASTRRDERAEFSNYGRFAVDVSAPGHEIYSTWPGGEYRSLSGTSMAAPHVAGAAALVAQKFPEASPVELRHRLIHNSDSTEALADTSLSGGRLNVAAALEADTVAPAAPKDLRISEIGTEFYRVEWTVPGDDAWCGVPASQFEYKVSTEPIETMAEFDALPNRTSRPNTQQVGELHSLQQFRPQTADETVLYAALRVKDNVGNSSELRRATLVIPGFDVLYEDDMESKQNWTPDEHFGTEQWPERGTVWSDSPGKDYQNNVNAVLTSKEIDLSQHEACLMEVEYKVDVAAGDHAFVEWSEDGENWGVVSQVFAQDDDFRATKFDLSNLSGKKVRFRFRLQSDGAGTRDGIMIDKVRVIGARPPE